MITRETRDRVRHGSGAFVNKGKRVQGKSMKKEATKRSTPVRQIDVARRVGVSRACVSLVLNPDSSISKNRIPVETARRIREVAKEMGYRPNPAAQLLAGARSRVIGLLLDGQCDVMPTSRMTTMMFAMQHRAFEKGYRLLLANTYDDDQVRDYIEDFKARNVEGVLCLHLSEKPTCKSLMPALSELDNVVFYKKPDVDGHHSFVHVDYAYGVAEAVRHLAGKGHTRIGLAVYSARPYPMVERITGYRQGIEAAGMKYDRKLVWEGDGTGLPNEGAIDDIIDTLVVEKKVDAVIASNDVWAVALIKRLIGRGMKVPDDVAVVGFDNIEDRATSVSPELTTIDHDDDSIGRAMVDMILDPSAHDGGTPRTTMVKPFLVIRASA